MNYTHQDILEVRNELGIGNSVASELMRLAGGDKDLVIKSSLESDGLDQCKAKIIDGRFDKLEEQLGDEDGTERE